jgi:ribosomal protein S18 acetylase RimI-like enzyme
MNPFSVLGALVRTRNLEVIWSELRRHLYSEGSLIGTQLDLDAVQAGVKGRQPAVMREMESRDEAIFTNLSGERSGGEEVMLRLYARRLLGSGLKTCYVLVGEDGTPRHMQYLIKADQNETIKRFFAGRVPPLKPDEGFLEFAFTPQRWRGRGLALRAMAGLIDIAKAEGLRKLVTFVPVQNDAMLKICELSGFRSVSLRTEKYRLFHRRVAFSELEPGSTYGPASTTRF